MAEQELILEDEHAKQLRHALGAQHALHGMFAEVLVRLGGTDFVEGWAQDNPGKFLTLLSRMTPGLMPQQGIQGDVHLHVHSDLGPTELDQ